jgi:hypothetical protein
MHERCVLFKWYFDLQCDKQKEDLDIQREESHTWRQDRIAERQRAKKKKKEVSDIKILHSREKEI